MKKLLLTISIVCMLLTTTCCSKENSTKQEEITEGKYPIKWDDTLIFKDEAQMTQDYNDLLKWPEKLQEYKGKLDTIDGLYGYVSTLYSYDFNVLYDKFNAYATFGKNAFPLEQKYIDCQKKLSDFEKKMEEAQSFFDDEMQTIPYEKRLTLFTDEKMIDYLDIYFSYIYEDISSGDDSALFVFNNATLSHNRMQRLQNLLVNFSIPDVEYKLKSGETLYINDGNISSILAKDYDGQTKKEIFDKYWGNVSKYADTLTYILETHMLEQCANAKLVGYENTRQMAISDMGFFEDIIQKVIDYAHLYSDSHVKYYGLYKGNSDKYYTYSKYKPLSSFDPGYIKYDDGVDDVVESLSILGDEYKQTLLDIINSEHVDVYQSDNKANGAFEIGTFAGQLPFVMFNYNGTTESVADVAHEMGHACYDELTHKNQSLLNWIMAIFTHEVASVTNELLYYEYKIANAETQEEKIYYTEMYLNRWSTDMFSGCIYQEFENYCHDIVDNGGTLNSKDLYDKWAELSKLYYGENLDLGEYGAYKWATLNGLYSNYYQYTYATSICYATVISERILSGDENAKEAYLEFLKAGGSLPSVEALSIAGIDIYDNSVYETALNHFQEKVDNLEKLLKK